MNQIVRKARLRNGEIILGYVEAAVRLNLPLVPFLSAAEVAETGRRRRQLGGVRQAIESGASLGAALGEAADVPEDAVARVAAAEPLGQVQSALRRAMKIEQEKRSASTEQGERNFYRFYPVFLMAAVLYMVTTFSIFIVPKLRDILKGFGMPLPVITEWLVNMDRVLFDDYGYVTWSILLAAGVVVLCVIAVYMNRLFLPSVQMPRFGALAERMGWRVPFIHGMHRDRGMAESCELLAEALRGGVPMPEAVRRCLALPVSAGFRRRLIKFQARLEGGATPADAARDARMPALLVGMLQPLSAGAVGESGDLFEFLAHYYRQKFSRAAQVIQAAVEPAVVIACGTVVLTIMLALFLPVMAMINQAASLGPGGAL